MKLKYLYLYQVHLSKINSQASYSVHAGNVDEKQFKSNLAGKKQTMVCSIEMLLNFEVHTICDICY